VRYLRKGYQYENQLGRQDMKQHKNPIECRTDAHVGTDETGDKGYHQHEWPQVILLAAQKIGTSIDDAPDEEEYRGGHNQ
jgi:hypothetical protein